MKLQRADWNWFVLIIVGWATLLGLVFAPPSLWFEVRSIHVDDSTVGTTPKMRVDRSIYRTVPMTAYVTVAKKWPSGFAIYCPIKERTQVYKQDAVLPDDLDLDWYTFGDECAKKLPAGKYRLDITWVIHPPLFPDKLVRQVSNTFEKTQP